MTDSRHLHVANVADVEGNVTSTGTRFACTRKALGKATFARGIGCSWYEVPPGRSAFPRHFHCANEEAIYVLEGDATLRIGEQHVALRAGDYATIPVGPDHAHELVNSGAGALRYLCLSTMLPTEVVGYPDSGKILALGTPPPDPKTSGAPWVRVVAFEASSVGYYEGENIELPERGEGQGSSGEPIK